MYQMSINKINNVWVEELIDTHLSVDLQWEKLINILE